MPRAPRSWRKTGQEQDGLEKPESPALAGMGPGGRCGGGVAELDLSSEVVRLGHHLT